MLLFLLLPTKNVERTGARVIWIWRRFGSEIFLLGWLNSRLNITGNVVRRSIMSSSKSLSFLPFFLCCIIIGQVPKKRRWNCRIRIIVFHIKYFSLNYLIEIDMEQACKLDKDENHFGGNIVWGCHGYFYSKVPVELSNFGCPWWFSNYLNKICFKFDLIFVVRPLNKNGVPDWTFEILQKNWPIKLEGMISRTTMKK